MMIQNKLTSEVAAMNKATVMEIVREAANKHGFEFLQYGNDVSIRDGKDWGTAWVNFSIWERDFDWDQESLTVKVRVEVTAATSRMGGNQSIEDLRKAADTISRAADLVEELKSMDLTYTVSYKKEEK